jgi:hypothetical protein
MESGKLEIGSEEEGKNIEHALNYIEFQGYPAPHLVQGGHLILETGRKGVYDDAFT